MDVLNIEINENMNEEELVAFIDENAKNDAYADAITDHILNNGEEKIVSKRVDGETFYNQVKLIDFIFEYEDDVDLGFTDDSFEEASKFEWYEKEESEKSEKYAKDEEDLDRDYQESCE